MGSSCGANFVNPGFAGLLDGVTMVEGHEFSETITDQNPFGGWWDSSGQENADKCAWISQGSARSQNVAFATGVFAMQSTWSNDGEACLIAHPVWGVPGLANSFVIDATPSAAYLAPGDSILSTLQSTTLTGDPQPITLTTTGGPPDATVTLSSATIQSDESATLTVETSPATPFGYYPITLTASGTEDRTTTFGVTVGPPPPVLQSGVPLTDLTGQAGSDQIFAIDVPPNDLFFTTSTSPSAAAPATPISTCGPTRRRRTTPTTANPTGRVASTRARSSTSRGPGSCGYTGSPPTRASRSTRRMRIPRGCFARRCGPIWRARLAHRTSFGSLLPRVGIT
jgi:hypothetical protein